MLKKEQILFIKQIYQGKLNYEGVQHIFDKIRHHVRSCQTDRWVTGTIFDEFMLSKTFTWQSLQPDCCSNRRDLNHLNETLRTTSFTKTTFLETSFGLRGNC